MYKNYYFLGIGGIGMSALARYFKAKGVAVAGYDRTASRLTHELENEGIDINYDDNAEAVPLIYRNPVDTMVVYTPAIPSDNRQFRFFSDNGFIVSKRAAVLGDVTRLERGLCVAGTHGKTTTSTMIAHLLKQSHVDCNAFLGGISNNYSGNLLLSDKSDLVVIEADEFDRSFHHLSPYMAVVTATDPDHLDIYGNYEAYLEAFAKFTSLVRPGGTLIMKKGIALKPDVADGVSVYTYSANEKADFYAENVVTGNGLLTFDFVAGNERIDKVNLGVPMMVNVENAVAAMAVALLNGATHTEIRTAMDSFSGIRRRFEFRLKTDKTVIIDDYAHHPKEIEASLRSVKQLYADKKILAVFQPHLYSRTRDFHREFASALSLLDNVAVTEIYPARELPIEGVSSQIIVDNITSAHKYLIEKNNLLEFLKSVDFDVLLTVGAGDIDTLLPEVVDFYSNQAVHCLYGL